MAKKETKSTKKDKLTLKQENACNFYIEEQGNQTAAYKRAFSTSKMSDKTITEKASLLFKQDKIRARVDELRLQLQAKSDITKEEAVKHLTNVVRSNVLDYVSVEEKQIILRDKEGKKLDTRTYQTLTVKNLDELTVEQQRCIKSIQQTNHGIKVELSSKEEALTLLSRMLGWDEAQKLDIPLVGGISIDEWIKNRK